MSQAQERRIWRWRRRSIAVESYLYFLYFDPSTLLQVFEAIIEIRIPVMHPKTQHSRMDKIELFPSQDVVPGLFGISDQEAAILRHSGRMNGRKICSQYLSIRVASSEIDCPDASAGAYVEDIRYCWSNGCNEESFVGEGLKPDVVLCVWESNEYSV